MLSNSQMNDWHQRNFVSYGIKIKNYLFFDSTILVTKCGKPVPTGIG
jgi:hypothetical protein